MSCMALGLEAYRELNGGLFVLTVLYEADTWDAREEERRRFNVFERKCLRGKAGVTLEDRIKHDVD